MKTAKLGLVLAACALPLAAWAGQVAYLGVATSPLEPRLARHLDLPKGVGLVVEQVADDGVLKGKVEEGDVLHKLNDQLLVTPEQLAILVRMQKPGTEVALTVVRRGKAEELKVKAGSIDESQAWQPGAGPMGPLGGAWRFQGPQMPENWLGDMQDRMREMHKQFRGRMPFGQPGGEADADADDDAKPEPGAKPAKPAAKARHGGNAPQVESRVQMSSSSVVTENRDGLTVTLTVKDGDKQVKAVGEDGKVVYEGPANNDGDLKQMPENVRDRVNDLEKRVKINVHDNSGGTAKPGPAARLHAL